MRYAITAVFIAALVTGCGRSDSLSYSEREALAFGLGYGKEVKRVAERHYAAEGQIPCAEDEYIDIDSLIRGPSRDMSDRLAIELHGCGGFIVTIYHPIDGVEGGKLLFLSSPGDTDAGQPLAWQCFSAQHEDIERHTNGECVYDPAHPGWE